MKFEIRLDSRSDGRESAATVLGGRACSECGANTRYRLAAVRAVRQFKSKILGYTTASGPLACRLRNIKQFSGLVLE